MNGRKLFFIGFVFILLIGIPVSIYLLQKQQETRTRAEKSTNLTFSPDSSSTNPIKKNINDSIPLDIMVNPGTNLVSFVRLSIQYDPDKLATDSASAFTTNAIVFPTVLEGPIYSYGKIEVTLSVGPDPTKAIQSLAKAGTITFKAIERTDEGQPTLVIYNSTTQVLSVGSSDQASENVLSSTTPATIVIEGAPNPTGSLTPTTVPPSATPIATPTTRTPTITATPTTVTPTGTGVVNQVPVCSTLAVDRATTGVAPFAITFTANGTDSDGTISKVNFNFGDGTTSEDIVTSGGIGTNSVNVAISHEYQNEGTYTASAVLTDNDGGVSDATACQQTIFVQSESETITATPEARDATSTPSPTIESPGSVNTAIGIGAAAMFLIIGGGLLFLIL